MITNVIKQGAAAFSDLDGTRLLREISPVTLVSYAKPLGLSNQVARALSAENINTRQKSLRLTGCWSGRATRRTRREPARSFPAILGSAKFGKWSYLPLTLFSHSGFISSLVPAPQPIFLNNSGFLWNSRARENCVKSSRKNSCGECQRQR